MKRLERIRAVKKSGKLLIKHRFLYRDVNCLAARSVAEVARSQADPEDAAVVLASMSGCFSIAVAEAVGGPRSRRSSCGLKTRWA